MLEKQNTKDSNRIRDALVTLSPHSSVVERMPTRVDSCEHANSIYSRNNPNGRPTKAKVNHSRETGTCPRGEEGSEDWTYISSAREPPCDMMRSKVHNVVDLWVDA